MSQNCEKEILTEDQAKISHQDEYYVEFLTALCSNDKKFFEKMFSDGLYEIFPVEFKEFEDKENFDLLKTHYCLENFFKNYSDRLEEDFKNSTFDEKSYEWLNEIVTICQEYTSKNYLSSIACIKSFCERTSPFDNVENFLKQCQYNHFFENCYQFLQKLKQNDDYILSLLSDTHLNQLKYRGYQSISFKDPIDLLELVIERDTDRIGYMKRYEKETRNI